ncbi:MAG: ribonuclease III [Clostridiales bacterium]|nr:ribonuclease III [Clostridiales bacterium]
MILNLNSSTDADKSFEPGLLSPPALAFIGDTVFDLFVREMLVREANRPSKKLHNLAAQRVCAKAQAEAIKDVWDAGLLTDEEISVLKRGRNAHTSHTPKYATERDYHLATGLETLFGYLYLKNETERLKELFGLICDAFDKRNGETDG